MSMNKSSGSSSSRQEEGSLAIAQRGILTTREGQYQQYFFPALAGELQSVTRAGGQPSTSEARAVASVSRAFDQRRSQLQQSLAQRGIDGGLEALALTQFAGAQADAVGDAAAASDQSRQNRLSQLLQIGGGLSPTPTSAAPIIGQSSSRQKSFGVDLSSLVKG